ncbi:WhiB family transcriptional regulator [Micromonospora sp. PSH03]|nr:WhiB family transcriptional regulator [Micromonospora salmantinae]
MVEAKRLCGDCPLSRFTECQAEGSAHEHGVFGGLSAEDRERLDPLGAQRLTRTRVRESAQYDRKIVVSKVLSMNAEGTTHQDVADATGLTRKAVVEIVAKRRRATAA